MRLIMELIKLIIGLFALIMETVVLVYAVFMFASDYTNPQWAILAVLITINWRVGKS